MEELPPDTHPTSHKSVHLLKAKSDKIQMNQSFMIFSTSLQDWLLVIINKVVISIVINSSYRCLKIITQISDEERNSR